MRETAMPPNLVPFTRLVPIAPILADASPPVDGTLVMTQTGHKEAPGQVCAPPRPIQRCDERGATAPAAVEDGQFQYVTDRQGRVVSCAIPDSDW